MLFVFGLVLGLTLGGAVAEGVEIWEIQGSGLESPLVGQVVDTGPNVVTALTDRGFFMQTPPERTDRDPATSDGLYVYLGHTPKVHTGDLVRVTGTVTEYHGMTELSSSPAVTVLDSGAALPPPVDLGPSLPSGDPPPEASLEPLEDMLVRVAAGTITGPTSGETTFWVVARDGRAFREPGIPYPGEAGLPVWDGNPEVLRVELGHRGAGEPENGAAAGLPITGLEGPLAYSWGAYEIWAAAGSYRISGTPAATPAPRPGRSELTVATQNVERLYDTVDDPSTKDDVPTVAELDTKLAKLSRWIREVLGAPVVVALQEVENLGVLENLADQIHADGGPRYVPELLEGNDISGIDVGFLVKETFAVDSLEQLGAGDRFEYDGTDYTVWDRPPLLLRGRFTGNGAPYSLSLLNVHLRSRNGIEGSNGGFVREKRHQQALSLAHMIEQLQTAEPTLRLVVLGDFNAFEFTDGWVDVLGQVTGRPDPLGALIPVTDVVDPPLDDRVLDVPAASRYSFVHEGSAEVLDHVLTSTALTPWVREIGFAHGNADSPEGLATSPGTPLRCSDHDGLVLVLAADANGNGIPDDREPRHARPVHRALPAR